MGLVGINESGKTNVLAAIGTLSSDNQLIKSDSPKMARKDDPYTRFEFAPLKEEIESIKRELSGYHSLDKLDLSELTVTYHVRFNRSTEEEERFFTFNGISRPENTFVLRTDALTDGYMVKIGEEFTDLDEVILLSKSGFDTNTQLFETFNQLTAIEAQIEELNHTIASVADAASDAEVKEQAGEATGTTTDAVTETAGPNLKATAASSQDTKKERAKLDTLNKNKEALEKKLESFNPGQLLAEAREKAESLSTSETSAQVGIEELEDSLSEIENAAAATPEQTNQLVAGQKKLKALRTSLRRTQSQIRQNEVSVKSLDEPLEDKFTDDELEFSKHLGRMLDELLVSFLPKVVFWTYSDDFILRGETNFETILAAESLHDIPRPLVNLFRIGCEIKTIEELKQLVQEIQEDSSERSRHEDKLNGRIDEYLKNVWKDYDQKIKIRLEQERICVQFYDPKCAGASYYNMQERSQGCQTFISFLLTVGAEAKQGVIRDTILLLDEPETHLHPSGVRYMLQELIEAAKNGNTVVFATHSIFMIDKENYDRHIIVKKKKERTDFQPSKKDRIGYFVQEEVLYGALDFNPTTGVTTRNKYNFVLEGQGDALLFDCFYNQVIRQADRPTTQKNTSIYHGGKCSDIRKYLDRKPILLGSTWVFILDNDKPANQLRDYLEANYGEFLDESIYICQYAKGSASNAEIELEDMLDATLMREVLSSAAADLGCEIDVKKIDFTRSFGEYFPELATSCDNPKRFKIKVKEYLNSRIASEVKGIRDLEQMEQFASVYTNWAKKVIDKLKAE